MLTEIRAKAKRLADFLIQVMKFLEVVQQTLNGLASFLQGLSD